jgi:hypothetical protein
MKTGKRSDAISSSLSQVMILFRSGLLRAAGSSTEWLKKRPLNMGPASRGAVLD